MANTIYAKQLIVGCWEHLSYRFPDEDFVFAELDGVLTGFYNSIRWSVLRRARQAPSQEAIIDLPTTKDFASKWMGRDEIIDRIADTSGLEDTMAETCLTSIEVAVALSLAENETVAIPPIGVVTKARRGYLIQLDKALQLNRTSAKLQENASKVKPKAAVAGC